MLCETAYISDISRLSIRRLSLALICFLLLFSFNILCLYLAFVIWDLANFKPLTLLSSSLYFYLTTLIYFPSLFSKIALLIIYFEVGLGVRLVDWLRARGRIIDSSSFLRDLLLYLILLVIFEYWLRENYWFIFFRSDLRSM